MSYVYRKSGARGDPAAFFFFFFDVMDVLTRRSCKGSASRLGKYRVAWLKFFEHCPGWRWETEVPGFPAANRTYLMYCGR